MCELKTLASSEHGYVAVCPKCGQYYTGFGTSQILLTEFELRALAQHLKRDALDGRHKVCPRVKAYVYPTNSRRVQLVFNHQEVEWLNQLMSRALLRIDMAKLAASNN